MDARRITDRYFVSPQIDPEDLPGIAEAGFTRVICNRPDAEVPPSHQAASIAEAAKAAGVDFEVLPLTHQTMTPENVGRQATLVEDGGEKVLAYCASGTRCTVVWALSRAGQEPVGDILSRAAEAGYDLGGLAPTLEALAAQR
jgi:uncharacterized protein (TIGR01244 family)